MRHIENNTTFQLFKSIGEAKKAAPPIKQIHGELWVQSRGPGFVLRNGAAEVFDESGMVTGYQERLGLMIIVHPGSLCGSYHSSGDFSAPQLEALLNEIHAWRGQFAVFHGEFSDEIPHYSDVKRAIEHAKASGGYSPSRITEAGRVFPETKRIRVYFSVDPPKHRPRRDCRDV